MYLPSSQICRDLIAGRFTITLWINNIYFDNDDNDKVLAINN